jgi:arylamine N-acetyltransferase
VYNSVVCAMSVTADYLNAIGLPDAVNGKPNLELLHQIYTAHGEKLAFSSINVLQGEPVKMRAPTALKSIAVCKRGGVCCKCKTLSHCRQKSCFTDHIS